MLVIWLSAVATGVGMGRGAESQTWARGQLEYDGFPVL